MSLCHVTCESLATAGASCDTVEQINSAAKLHSCIARRGVGLTGASQSYIIRFFRTLTVDCDDYTV